MATVDNSFKTLGCEGKERDFKKIALGALKEVQRNFYLLEMGENFTCSNATGKVIEKMQLKEKTINCITNDPHF